MQIIPPSDQKEHKVHVLKYRISNILVHIKYGMKKTNACKSYGSLFTPAMFYNHIQGQLRYFRIWYYMVHIKYGIANIEWCIIYAMQKTI